MLPQKNLKKSLFQDYLKLVESKKVSNDVLDFLKQKLLSIPQKTLLEITQNKLKELNINDPEFPIKGICLALSRMHAVVTQSKNLELRNVFFKGMVMIAYHQPPQRDFSDVILKFYDCFKLLQDNYYDLEMSEEQLLQFMQDPIDPIIETKFSLPFLFSAKELEFLFEVLESWKYLKNVGTTFFVNTPEHATSCLYKEKKYFYFNSNDAHGEHEIGEVKQLIQHIKNAIFINQYVVTDERNEYIPIQLSFFVSDEKSKGKNNIRIILNKVLGHLEYMSAVHRRNIKTGITAIWLAAQQGDNKAIKLFQTFQANPNVPEIATGFTPFMIAIINKYYKAAQALTEFSKKKDASILHELDVNAKDLTGGTALLFAVETSKIKYVSLVLINGGAAVINDYDDKGCTPLLAACLKDRSNIVELLLKNGADPNTVTPQCPSILFQALADGKKTKIFIALVEAGANINHVDADSGCSIFLTAVYQGYYRFVRYLLSLQLDPITFVNAKTGESAIEIALDNNDEEMVEILFPFLAACLKGDIDRVQHYLHAAFNCNYFVYKQRSILSICLEKNVALPILMMLVAAGADVNYVDPNTGDSIFMQAIRIGHHAFVQELMRSQKLSSSAVINLKTNQKAIEIALHNNDQQMLGLISGFFKACQTNDLPSLIAMTQRNLDPNAIIYDNKSVLFVCLEQNFSLDILNLLLYAGANINFVDPTSGNSILIEAVKRKRVDFVRVLLGRQELLFPTLINLKSGLSAIEIALEMKEQQMVMLFSPLLYACCSGVIEDVRACFKSNLFNANEIVYHQKSILLVCLEQTVSFETLIELVKQKANINFVDPVSGDSILLTAVKKGRVDFVSHLLSNRNLKIETFINFRTNETLLKIACENNDVQMLEKLFSFGLKFALIDANAGSKYLLYAIKNQNYELVALFAQYAPELFKIKEEKTGNTPLHLAAKYSDERITNLILKVDPKQNLNELNAAGKTALYLAAKKNQTRNIEILIQQGAHKEVGFVVFDAATQQNQLLETPLVTAVLCGNLEAVTQLIKHGVNLQPTFGGNSPIIYWAVVDNMLDITEQLIAAGVDVNTICHKTNDDVGVSLLSAAILEGRKEMVVKLLELGAEINSTLECQRSGRTALYYAVQQLTPEICELLIRLKKPDLNFIFQYNKTPLTIALRENKIEMIELLLRHGADPHFHPSPYYPTAFDFAKQSNKKEILWLMRFYQQPTIQDKILCILSPYNNNKRHLTPGIYINAVKELKEKLLAIAYNSGSNELMAYDKIIEELKNVQRSSGISKSILNQINWFLDYIAPAKLVEILTPVPTQNNLLRKEELIQIVKEQGLSNFSV